jgi:hypothetical protein
VDQLRNVIWFQYLDRVLLHDDNIILTMGRNLKLVGATLGRVLKILTCQETQAPVAYASLQTAVPCAASG